ncbi:MAG: molybdenum cofactor guanylyltransferase [Candidatus Protistobacter heckmanni]|nr:molybdenum cofactor guanylyltransferase [Candidatus Protistobacter heckmanni]
MAANPASSHAAGVAGLVLAGGQGLRMGGRDKGLIDFRGKPLAAQVVERLAPQVERVILSANRNAERYAAFCPEVVDDAFAHAVSTDAASADHASKDDRHGGRYDGPLAGLLAGMEAARRHGLPLLAAAPCDMPFLPPDLVARLRQALEGGNDKGAVDLAYASAGDRTQPLVCLLRTALADHLRAWMADGGRKVMDWQRSLNAVEVAFADAGAFRNCNTPEDLEG